MKLLPFDNSLVYNKLALTTSLFDRNNSPYFLIGTYGALANPYLHLYQRIKVDMSNFLGRKFEEEEMTKYFLGVYKMPNRKIGFWKKGDDGFGRTTIRPSGPEDYVIMSVYCLPKMVLQLGTSKLMRSEGCFSSEYYSPMNNYVLFNNVETKLIALDCSHEGRNENIFPELHKKSVFVFIGAQHYLDLNCKPNKEYQEELVASLRFLKNKWRYEIEEGYINYIENL